MKVHGATWQAAGPSESQVFYLHLAWLYAYSGRKVTDSLLNTKKALFFVKLFKSSLSGFTAALLNQRTPQFKTPNIKLKRLSLLHHHRKPVAAAKVQK